jgi:hypothetical protein
MSVFEPRAGKLTHASAQISHKLNYQSLHTPARQAIESVREAEEAGFLLCVWGPFVQSTRRRRYRVQSGDLSTNRDREGGS